MNNEHTPQTPEEPEDQKPILEGSQNDFDRDEHERYLNAKKRVEGLYAALESMRSANNLPPRYMSNLEEDIDVATQYIEQYEREVMGLNPKPKKRSFGKAIVDRFKNFMP